MPCFNKIFNLGENGLYLAGLFVLGIFFSVLFEKSGDNIFIVAGVHSGAVFIIKAARVFFGFYQKKFEWFFGTSVGIDSIAGITIIIILILMLRNKSIRKFLKGKNVNNP